MDGDELVAVPALVFMEESQNMAEFMRGHPLVLPPPERGGVEKFSHEQD